MLESESWNTKLQIMSYAKNKNMCVYYCIEKLNRLGGLENVIILVNVFYMEIIWPSREFPGNPQRTRKTTLGSAAKNRVGRMTVNRHTFFLP